MKPGPILSSGLFIACAIAAAQESRPAAPFDGRWSVQLVCEDVKGPNSLVKGYDRRFNATIEGGKLHGEIGAEGAPSSVRMTGTVQPDGTLEVLVAGRTGDSDYTVGRVAQGTAYHFTMKGRLGPAQGQAVRRELRPCSASFTRQP